MLETPTIRGRIAKVVDAYNVIINRGVEHGVKLGMMFTILAPQGDEIIDPETRLPIGTVSRGKAVVRVTQAYEKWSIATTFRMVPQTTGLGVLFQPPSIGPALERLRTKEPTWDNLPPPDATVATGDPVVEVRVLPGS